MSPYRAAHTCNEIGCPRLVFTRDPRCEQHRILRQRAYDRQRGTPSERGYGAAWQKVRLEVLERDGYICRYCGRPANTADHVRPKIDGGADDPGNLVACCLRCNSARGGRRGHQGDAA